MAIRQNATEDQFQHRALTDDRPLNFLEHAIGVGADLAYFHRRSMPLAFPARNCAALA